MQRIDIKIVCIGFLLAATPVRSIDEIAVSINEAIASGEAMSAAVASWRGGERRYHFAGVRSSEGSGDGSNAVPPDRRTRYAIGSISKPFTNLLLAERVAEGHLEYSTTIGELLGESFAPDNPAVAEITLQQLATHTSGLPRLPLNLDVAARPADPYADYDETALRDGLETARAGQPLGNEYAYSNFGAGLLGWLLGEAAGSDYPTLLRREVIRPLRLEDTSLRPGDNAAAAFADGKPVPAWTFDTLAGAGGLWSSVDDLLKLAEVLVGARPNPLSHSLAVDFEPVADAGRFAVTRVWHVADSPFGPVFWHNGGTAGHRSFFGVRPATADALTILLAGGGLDPTGQGLEWFGVDAATEPPGNAIDASILGQYALTDAVGIGVFEADGGLRAQLSGQSAVSIEPIGDDWYRLDVADASLRFVRENGAVVAVELVQNGAVQRADRTADRAAVLDRDAAEIDIDPAALDAFVGEYALNERAVFTVRRGGESGLEVRLTGQPFFPVFPRGDGVFFYKIVEAELHFERDEAGRVDAVVLHQGGLEQRAERVE